MTQQQHADIQETTVVSVPQTQTIHKTSVVTPRVETDSPQENYETKKVIFRSYQIIWYILGVVEVLLTFRVVLKLLGARSYSGFTSFIYAISNPLATPFDGVLGTTRSIDSVFEWSTLIAMTVYAVVAYGIVALFQLVKPTNQQEVEQSVDHQ